MNDLEQLIISQMRDVKSVHEVSPYPVAIGWWFVLALIVAIILFNLALIYKKRQYRKSWMFELEQQLDNMIKNFDQVSPKKTISELNELMKRIAMQFYKRTETASMEGIQWLKWLSARDPNGFNWIKKGKILIMYPYMQEEKVVAKKSEVVPLIKAIKEWVK